MRKNYGVDIHERKAKRDLHLSRSYTSIHHQGLRPEEAQDVRQALLQLIRFVSHEQFRFLTHGENGGALGHLFRMFLPEEDSRIVDLLDSDETRVCSIQASRNTSGINGSCRSSRRVPKRPFCG